MFDVSVFPTLMEAEHFLAGEGTIVFMASVLESNARKFQRDNPGVRVVLLTGADEPKDVPFIVPKKLVNKDNLRYIMVRSLPHRS